jgi:hypothetical protein
MTASSSAWLGAALVVFACVPARADSAPPLPSEAQVNAARVLYREARELERAGKVKEALEKALQAYDTASTPVTALEAATLLVQTQQLVEARNMAESVATMPISPRESDKGRDARQQAASLADALDARIPKIAAGERPVGVDALLDGKPLPQDAMVWQGVNPGAHTLELRIGDRSCTTLHMVLAEREQRTVDLQDAAATCKPAPTEASVPAVPLPTPALVLQKPENPSSLDEGAMSHPWRPVAGVMVGLGVASVGLGGVLAVMAKINYESVAKDCLASGCSLSAYSTRKNAVNLGNIATEVTIPGAVALAGGVILWLGDPGRTRVQVALGPASVRLAVPLR